MKIKLACADFTFQLLPFEATLDLIKALNVQAVDISLYKLYNHLHPVKELKRPEKMGARLRAMVADRGLEIADVFLVDSATRETLAPNNIDPKDNRKSREVFERGLDYLNAAGCTHMTQLPGVNFAGQSIEACFNRSAKELGWRAERAAKRGITFSVEPHFNSVVDTPATALRMIECAPGLTYSLDYTHFTRSGYKDSQVEPLLKHASHFHVRGARKGRLQTSFSKNTINYKRILRKMKQLNYRGYMALEYVWIEWEHSDENDCLCESILFRDNLNAIADDI
jgi:sugar phosphate isomerase/epimerase